MRHNKKLNHLGRQSGHRKAMLANMASSLLLHKRIETTLAKAKALKKYVEPLITRSTYFFKAFAFAKAVVILLCIIKDIAIFANAKRITTTLAKAKALRVYVEPLITKSKIDSTNSRRVAFSYLKQKEAVTELFRVIAPKIAERPGGYTRILRTSYRAGDAAEMAIMELVDFNEAALNSGKKEAGEKKNTRRSRAKKVAEPAAPKAEAPKAEASKAEASKADAPKAE